jgi:hypothetical protein
VAILLATHLHITSYVWFLFVHKLNRIVNFSELFLVEIYRKISQFLFVMFKLCTNKNHTYKHNEQINNQNIDNSECFGVKFVKIYPEMTLTIFFF